MLTENQRIHLFNAARESVINSYVPYSSYAVGAAVMVASGEIFAGVNVENASYGLTICAERVAICNTITNGRKDIIAVAIFSSKGDAIPCGACRQFIIEFGDNIEVITMLNGNIISHSIKDMIPNFFSGKDLQYER